MRYARKSAFTLVELLVVIAIIALLLSILMPALNKARGQARAVICMSNVRQIGVASAAYRTEYKGIYPPSNYDFADYYANPAKYKPWYAYATWFSFLKSYLGEATSKVNMCPSLAPLFINQKLSYSFNVAFGYCLNENGTWENYPPVKDSQVKNAADKILIIEAGPSYCNTYYVYNNGKIQGYPPDSYAYRLYPVNNWHNMRMCYEFTPGTPGSVVHDRWINSVYADGHAQKDDIVSAMNPIKWFPVPDLLTKFGDNPWDIKVVSSRSTRFPKLNPSTP
jgi:prepilin-type N-terminal cleavage/methylation domain-containing protein